MRHQEYLERQAARAARDDVVKPKKFEHEVSSRRTVVVLLGTSCLGCCLHTHKHLNRLQLGSSVPQQTSAAGAEP